MSSLKTAELLCPDSSDLSQERSVTEEAQALLDNRESVGLSASQESVGLSADVVQDAADVEDFVQDDEYPPLVSPVESIHVSEVPHGTAWQSAGVDSRDSRQTTSSKLHAAALRADLDLVRKMIGAGASVNVPIGPMKQSGSDNDLFVTLLHVLGGKPSLQRGVEVMTEIARGKANLNARSSLGSTPLARACLHKHLHAAELLLELGADPAPVDDRGRTALLCAVSLEIDTTASTASSVEAVSGGLVSLLASKKADLDGSGPVTAPLLEAIKQVNRPAVAALIRHGAKPKFLHAAVERAPASIVDDLLKGQANPLEEDSEGKTVLDIAFRRGDEEITTMLRDSIGDLERRNHNANGSAEAPIVPFRTSDHLARSNSAAEEEAPTLGLSAEITQKSTANTDKTTDTSSARRNTRKRFSMTPTSVFGQRRSLSLTRTGDAGFHMEAESSALSIAVKDKFGRLQQACRRLNRDKTFQVVMLGALLGALFFPDLWVICDTGTNDGLDFFILIVFIIFIIELAVQTIGMPKTYINSFFFWMDVIGLLSVPLDHSFVSDNLPRSLDNAVVMRAARTARLGARAGRFTKLVKLLRFLPGVHGETGAGSAGTARSMSNALMTSLSTRVSCLIILMVMVLPLFEMTTYPENDYSMKAWMNSLDFSLQRYGVDLLEDRVLDFEAFYENKDYYPFQVHWTSNNGTSGSKWLKRERPRRLANQLDIKANSGLVRAVFNFGSPNRDDAVANMILMIVIIILMMGFCLLLSNSVSAIVLQPLENLLSGVQRMASKIFKSVTTMAAKCACEDTKPDKQDGDEEDDGQMGNETQLLERVIDKLATLSAITMKSSPLDAETLEQLGESDRAVLQGFSQSQLPPATPQISRKSNGSETSSNSDEAQDDHTEELVMTLERNLEEAGLAWPLVDSWDFNALEIGEQQRHLSCLCFIVFHLGLGYTGRQQACLMAFIEAAAVGYGNPVEIPYHNWYHAVDVTHAVFRLLNYCATERFLSNYERFALVTSAVCHDIGHPGTNNPFLIEAGRDLAIRYNDHSPLENMHCAKLFELVSQPKTAVFATLDRQQYKEVRQVCIEAILHTDNIHHFPMVKELQVLYEMNSDIFDISLQMTQTSQMDFPCREICDIFSEPEKRKLMRNLFLHFSDISNPMKPFPIAKRWAWNIIDEFFLQGDREKSLGITVQPLNDRDKVNRPYSQVGFIEFFIAPFSFAAVRVLPPLVTCTDQMMMNLNAWCEEWKTTTSPAPEAEEVVKLQERIAKLEAKFIFRDGF